MKQKVDSLLKLEGRDYDYLAQRLELPKDKLLSLLDRKDLMPEFIERLAGELHTTSHDLLDEASDNIPWLVYESHTPGMKHKIFKALFQTPYCYFLTCLGFEMIILYYMGITDSAMRLVMLVCGIALAIVGLVVYPLSYYLAIPQYVTDDMKVALYERGVDFYKVDNGETKLLSRFEGRDALVCYETKEMFILNYQYSFNKSVAIPKDGIGNEAMEKLRSLLESQSSLAIVKEKIPFEHFNRMDTFEKAKRRNLIYKSIYWTVMFAVFMGMIFGFGIFFSQTDHLDNLFAYLYATMSSLGLLGLFCLTNTKSKQ